MIYDWNHRSKYVYETIKRIDADIMMIQEVHKSNVNEFISTLDMYTWYFVSQNSRDGITNIGIGYKKDKFDPSSVSFSSVNFNQYKDGNEVVVFAQIEDDLFCSVHFPTNKNNRESMASHFEDVLKNFNAKRIVIAGDFNSFPVTYGYHQIPILNSSCGTYSATEYACFDSKSLINTNDIFFESNTLTNDLYAEKSFEPYPFDYVSPSTLKLIGKLDHILVKGYTVKKAAVYDHFIKGTLIHPSDHFPVAIIL